MTTLLHSRKQAVTARQLKKDAEALGADIAKYVRRRRRAASRQVRYGAEMVAENTTEAAENAVGFVRRNPAKSVAVAVATLFVAAALIRR